jgi:hypothetical protein
VYTPEDQQQQQQQEEQQHVMQQPSLLWIQHSCSTLYCHRSRTVSAGMAGSAGMSTTGSAGWGPATHRWAAVLMATAAAMCHTLNLVQCRLQPCKEGLLCKDGLLMLREVMTAQ